MNTHKIVIVGAGFGGLCMAIKLKNAGITDFLIIEKSAGLGGTWRENTYPGAECDIPSALYSYSFEHNADWEFKWSGQQQILKYQRDTAEKYKLAEHIRFNQTIVKAVYDETNNNWSISTSDGNVYQAQHFITAVGQLHYPSMPTINNEQAYQGIRFHSAGWNHDIDLSNKRIGVIGNAASAVQFVPEIAKLAKHVTVYQRSANWMLPKLDRPYAKWEQRLSAKLPSITKLYRWYIWAVGEYGVFAAIKGNRLAKWILKKISLRALKQEIPDPALLEKLIPDYEIGAKRILFSDHYYSALSRDNVSLVTQPIDAFVEQGIKQIDGTMLEHDVVIYGTGFKTNPFFAYIDIRGINNQSIQQSWDHGAHAYLGISTHGFPNFHMLYGPNTNLGHTSVIIMHEAQADYIVQQLQYLDRNNLVRCDVKQHVEQNYNDQLQQRLANLAFSKIEHSWYMDGSRITNNWAGGTREYKRLLKTVDWNSYETA